MVISDFQKELISKIAEGKIFDILSFMVEYLDLPDINSRADFETIIYNFRVKGITEKIKVKNVSNACKRIVEYFIICSYLEKESLLFKKSSDNFINFHYIAESTDAKSKDELRELNSLLYKYPRDEYYPSPELSDFIKNNYKMPKDKGLIFMKRLNLIFFILTILYILSITFISVTALKPHGNIQEKKIEVKIDSNNVISDTTFLIR